VVHNGTIENYEELVRGLEERGHERRSDTDTEVVAHLLEERYADGPTAGDLPASLRSVCKDLEGSFVLVVCHRDEPDLVVAARRNLPLVIGLGKGENFVGSDVTAFIAHTRTARAVEQDQVVEVRRSGVTVTDLEGTVVEGDSYHVDWDTDAAEKGGYDFFMLKEMEEQPGAVRDTLGGRLTEEGLLHLDELAMSDEDVRASSRSSSSPAARPTTRAWSASTPSSGGPGSRCRSRWPASSATGTRSSAATPWSSPSRSPARPPTRSRRCGTPAASGPG
jgi:glucosamine--fructose-6-phosphate aminotransferase (isomerizing)